MFRDSRPHYLFEADLEGTRPASGKVLLVLLPWICDIYFPSVSLGPSESEPLSAPTQALAARAGTLESLI